jgi:hypothetical protein
MKEGFKMKQIDVNALINKAKKLVVDYFNSRVDETDKVKITEDQVFIVWHCKTLQNWKAMVSTTISDGMYYEVTYDGDRKQTYLDAYKKWENKCIPDSEE